ncbi:SDR family NAD(P)-dependent oxidoreductase [Novosphingobium sp.]|uniref:SDR family NAD(P)-dependent oxidoreductase n=1 Tax=Novosphingobium sp. TaxID=1874826 RepID=UPI00286E5ACA|nr:SDR family NAD(P)-dependent oxidoreductase [Novosphingobium sp.]
MANKVALVTGGQAGIGAACAKRLARDGVAIGVLDLTADLCADTVAAIEAAGGEAIALGADISDRAQVKAAVAKLRETFGPITILVNNAGITDFVPFEEITEARWEVVYRINVLGQIIVAQEVLSDMKAKGWGRIVNISSSSGQTGAVGMCTYSSSKGAVITLTRSMAQELGPLGITVNNIPPGSVMGTIMSEANRDKFQIPTEMLLQAIPVRRMGEPNDIANACAWLCHEDSGYVNGQTIGVNGGRVVS